MGSGSQKSNAIEVAARQIELIEMLQRAVDRSYRRLREAARADWERLFASKDWSNKRASVRVHPAEGSDKKTGLPGSGFLKPQKTGSARENPKGSRTRFAH